MTDLTDIYLTLNLRLLDRKYYRLDKEEQVLAVDQEMTKYIIDKIKTLNKDLVIDEEMSLPDLVRVLGSMVDIRNFKTIDQITHFILGIMSTIQGFHIVWYLEENSKLVDNPIVEINNNVVNKITTHINHNSLDTFEFIYDYYINYFNKKDLSLEFKK